MALHFKESKPMENNQNEYKKTLQELEQTERKSADLLKWIIAIVENLKNGELTLTDIVAEEESLMNRCEELQDTCKDIIKLRQWLDFLDLETQF